MGKFFYISVTSITLLFLMFSSATIASPEFDKSPVGGDDFDLGPIRFGRIEVHPGLGFETRYTDNVFLNANSEGKVEDTVYTIIPSVDIELERGAGELFGFLFLYKGEDEHYDKLRDTQDTFNHNAAARLNFGGPGLRSDLSVGAFYNKSRNVGNRDFQSNLGNRVDSQTTAGFLDFIYSYSDVLDFQLDLDFKREQYDESFSLQNADTYDFGGSTFWQATPLLAYGFKYNHRIRDYETLSFNNDNSHEDQLYLAFKWEPTTLIEGEFSIGIDLIRFQNVSEQDTQNLVYEFNLNYHPRERTEFYLRSSRKILDSTFENIQTFIYSNIGLGFTQKLMDKFKLQVDGVYENRDYRRPTPSFPNKVRKDNNIESSVALIYQIKWWLQAKAKYNYRQNKSNFDNVEFTSNTGLFEVSLKY
jgi:hypothetical protein